MSKKITIINGVINLEPRNLVLPIAKKYPSLEKEYLRLEPDKNTSYSRVSSDLDPVFKSWLPQCLQFRTP